MAQRINISIPDELYERLQEFKDRITVSKICQDAIEHAVNIEAMKELEGDKDFEKLVSRLSQEKEKVGRRFIEQGFEAGKRDAQGLSLNAFMELIYLDSSWKGKLEALSFEEIENIIEGADYRVLKSHMNDYASDHTMQLMRFEQSDPYSDIEFILFGPELIAKGWIKGVLHVWREVRSRI